MGKLKKYVIDGHNLIPKVPGIRLQDAEDEYRLIEMLNEYCRLSRSQVEVFFDGAPTPGQTARKSGLVHPHFVRKGLSADDAIIEYARKNQSPTNLLTVISSDHRIVMAVKSVGCTTMSSDAFAIEMQRIFSSPLYVQGQKDKKLSEDEVTGWLNEFENNQIRPDNS